MSQKSNGLYKLLNIPQVYEAVQSLIGANKSRKTFVQNYLRPQPGYKILDIGCGPARILDFLPETVVYYGFDFGQRYIDDARQRYGDRAHFFCGRVQDMETELDDFDLVIASAVLHHLDDNEALDLFSLSHRVLRTGGRLISLDCCYIENQNPIAKFIIDRDRGNFTRTPELYSTLARQYFDDCKGWIEHKKIIPYTYWIMECIK